MNMMTRWLLLLALGCGGPVGLAQAQDIDFGNDSSEYANDGECDDPRFQGPGMTGTILLDSDIRADATDCRTAFERGMLWLREDAPTAPQSAGDIDFGDDSSGFARDGECDDPRFEGPAMAAGTLLDSDTRADATDCRSAFERGAVWLKGNAPNEPIIVDGIDFGTDSGSYTWDDECDDPRFEGAGMTASVLSDDNIKADATDCAGAYQAGNLRMRGDGPAGPVVVDGIDFGFDNSPYSRDGECDDPRFEGPGMTGSTLYDANIKADATDCLEAYRAGSLTLTPYEPGSPVVVDGIDFGLDTSPFARDGECDDPRFEGLGMTAAKLFDSSTRADASDCVGAYRAGNLAMRGEGTAGPVVVDGIDFGVDSSPYSRDGECDDPRFEGSGMTGSTLYDSNIKADATDCRQAYQSGAVTPSDYEPGRPIVVDGIDFGQDSGVYARDGECDDPRFEGPGMTSAKLYEGNIQADASDCASAYRNGAVQLRATGGGQTEPSGKRRDSKG
jgi:hypothetical protein